MQFGLWQPILSICQISDAQSTIQNDCFADRQARGMIICEYDSFRRFDYVPFSIQLRIRYDIEKPVFSRGTAVHRGK
jgi:hypothetical protein